MLDGLSVNAYNAEKNCFEERIVKKRNSKYHLAETSTKENKSKIYLSPGWIDMHTHIFDGFGIFGIIADDIGYKTGVCMLVDAGTTGDYTITGFRKYVEPTIKTNFKLFICISPIGVIFHHEYNALDCLDVKTTVQTIEANRDIISGVKVRMCSTVINHESIKPLQIASDVARITDLPLMVHIGRIPPSISKIEPYMKKGDILTHIFNGKDGDAWNSDGTPSKSLRILLDRGVILDVGHGSESFSFTVCKKALKHSLPKISIGTDLHAYSRKNSVFNMATTLSKMLGLSITLEDVIYGVTKLPSDILRLENWCDMTDIQKGTLFRVDEDPAEYTDSYGMIMRFDKKIVPIGVILNNSYIDLHKISRSPTQKYPEPQQNKSYAGDQ